MSEGGSEQGAATVIDLIRHGEPVGGRRYRGQIDDPLSERGWRQMWDAVGDCADWQAIVTSTLSRCNAFAEALGQRRGIEVVADPRFKEVGFGVWEGHTPDELLRQDPDSLARFYHDPIGQRPHGAEPLHVFSARVVGAWEDVVQSYTGQHVLLVAHAGVIRAVLAHVLGAPLTAMYRIKVDNAAVTRFRLDAGRPPMLVFHGGRL